MGEGNPVFLGIGPAPALEEGKSIERKATWFSTPASMGPGGAEERKGNAYHSRDNEKDFLLRPVSDFQNRLSPPERPATDSADFYIEMDEPRTMAVDVEKGLPRAVVFSFNLYTETEPLTEIFFRIRFVGSPTNVIEKATLENRASGISAPTRFISNDASTWWIGAKKLPRSFTVTGGFHSFFLYFDLARDAPENTSLFISLYPQDIASSVSSRPIGSPVVDGGRVDFVRKVFFSEIQTGGEQGVNDEFIELYNPHLRPVSLGGWSLHYQSSSGRWQRRILFENDKVIPSRGFFLIGGSEFAPIRADLTRSLRLSGSQAGFGLRLENNQGAVVDRVAFGDAEGVNATEEKNFPVPGSGMSVERKAYPSSRSRDMIPGGRHAYEGNGCDLSQTRDCFIYRDEPDPQNTSSESEPVPGIQVLAAKTGGNHYGGLYVIEGRYFLPYTPGYSRLLIGNHSVDLRAEGNHWGNDRIEIRVPIGLPRSNDVTLIRCEGENGQVSQILRDGLLLGLPTLEAPSIEEVQPGREVCLRGLHLGLGIRWGMVLSVAGLPVPARDIQKWSTNEICFIYPYDRPLPIGSTIAVSNIYTDDAAGAIVASYANAPPVLVPELVSLHPVAGGLDQIFELTLRYVDPEEDPAGQISVALFLGSNRQSIESSFTGGSFTYRFRGKPEGKNFRLWPYRSSYRRGQAIRISSPTNFLSPRISISLDPLAYGAFISKARQSIHSRAHGSPIRNLQRGLRISNDTK